MEPSVKRKHRVYVMFAKRGGKVEDWNHVKNLKNEITKMIINTKNEHYLSLGLYVIDLLAKESH